MKNKFHDAFEPIRAAESLKQNTNAFIHDAILGKQRKARAPLRAVLACCAIAAIVISSVGGYLFYEIPVSYISVDVNPSVELGLNRLDRVVTADAYNDDGALILQNLNLKNKPYTEAVEMLLSDESFAGYLAEDFLLSFTVVSSKEEVLLAGIQQCQGYAQANAECHGANAQLVENAHRDGLSFGKYQAYLDLLQYDSTITIEDCKALTIQQIRALINRYQDRTDIPADARHGNGHHGENRGAGHGGGIVK